jgi:hypothetical protein
MFPKVSSAGITGFRTEVSMTAAFYPLPFTRKFVTFSDAGPSLLSAHIFPNAAIINLERGQLYFIPINTNNNWTEISIINVTYLKDVQPVA